MQILLQLCSSWAVNIQKWQHPEILAKDMHFSAYGSMNEIRGRKTCMAKYSNCRLTPTAVGRHQTYVFTF